MNSTHYTSTIGGLSGYLLRRLIHVSMMATPFIYYFYGDPIAGFFGLSLKHFMLAIIGLSLLLEVIRLSQGWVLWGQRQREKGNISSFVWTVLSVCLVLLLAPGKEYAIPIIWSCSIGDPLLGELRRTRLSTTWIFLMGMMAVMLIWWLASGWFGIDWLLALLMGPLTILLEWPNFRWIDDNALMQLIPLLVILILYG